MKQVDRYLEFMEYGRNLRPKTIQELKSDFNNINFDIENAIRYDVESYIIGLNKQGLSTGTINRRLATLSGFFEWQLYNGLRQGLNPAGGKIAPKVVTEHHQAITKRELDMLYNHAPNNNIKGAIALMGYAGLRISECVKVGSENKLYRDKNNILAVHLVDTKGGKERKVTLALVPDVDVIDKIMRDGGFVGQRGLMTHNGLWRQLKNYFSDMGYYDLTIHGLRATFATMLAENSVRIDVIRDIMGHVTLGGNEITSRYIAVTSVEEQARELLEKREGLEND